MLRLAFCVFLFIIYHHIVVGVQDEGYYCVGCATVLEELHLALVDAMEATARRRVEAGSALSGTVQVDMRRVLGQLCDTKHFQRYNPDIREACAHTVQHNMIPLLLIVSGDATTAELAFERISEFCIGKLDVCDARYVALASQQEPGTQCVQCVSVLGDMQAVLQRQSTWLRSRSHVWQTIERECNTLGVRFPSATARPLQAMCETMLADNDDAIAHVLMNDMPFGHACVEMGYCTLAPPMHTPTLVSPWFRHNSHTRDEHNQFEEL